MQPDVMGTMISLAGVFICGGIFAVLIGGVLLRSSVSIVNRIVGGGEPTREEYQSYPGTVDPAAAADNPFAAPAVQTVVRQTGGGIPVPTVGRAMLIALVTTAANFAVSFALGFILGGTLGAAGQNPAVAMLPIQILSFVVTFAIGTGIRVGMLPTTVGRGLLVQLFEYLIILAIALVVGIVLAGVAVVLGGLG